MQEENFDGIELIQKDTALDTEHALGIGRMPGRKQVCLYLREGASITPVAFFKDPEHAKQVMGWLQALAGVGHG